MSRIVELKISVEDKLRMELKAIDSLRKLKLIGNPPTCTRIIDGHVCNAQFAQGTRKREKDSPLLPTYRCSKCGTFQSIYNGSFFCLSTKRLYDQLFLVKCFALQISAVKTFEMALLEDRKVKQHMVGKYYRRLRNILTVALDKPNLKIGGPGHVIQIDESLFARVKHNVGKDLRRKQVWNFGLTDTKTGEAYMEIVPDRTAKTLLRIIHQHVLPGSTIYSDKWSSYNKIRDLNFQHQSVNHTYNFIEPGTLTCTNTIESLWCAAKMRFKDMRGCDRTQIQSYIDEFLWRQNNCANRTDNSK
jgi:transposase-like protein